MWFALCSLLALFLGVLTDICVIDLIRVLRSAPRARPVVVAGVRGSSRAGVQAGVRVRVFGNYPNNPFRITLGP